MLVLERNTTLRVYDSILETIGWTPLVRLRRIPQGLACPIYAKLEFFNPGGSVKDRIGLRIIEAAEREGRLRPGGTIVEATSGNTGVGLAIVAALKGYKTVFVMPDKMSQEKIQLLRAFGARVVITPTAVPPEDPRSYYNVARRIVEETPNAILANQYHNPENPKAHYLTTGPEIWEQTQGRVTDVVIGMGTGGTITGVARYLKERNPEIRVVGVDPEGSILKEAWENGGVVPPGVEARPYKVEGIGEDFVPSTLDLSLVDEVIRVDDREAFLMARRLVREEGIFAGGSSGAALAAALKYARDLGPDRLVVVVFPDTGSRYLSKIFNDAWMREHGFLEGDWRTTTLRELLERKSIQGLIAAHPRDSLRDVVARMRAYDISQMPVLTEQGRVIGMVYETDLLRCLAAQGCSPQQSVQEAMAPPPPSRDADTTLEDALPVLLEESVLLVTDGGKPIGLLTRIDVLDYINQVQS